MIDLKRVIRKINKYIRIKIKKKYEKLEVSLLKNATSSSVSKNARTIKKLLEKLIYSTIK